jgi:hypothetical protein
LTFQVCESRQFRDLTSLFLIPKTSKYASRQRTEMTLVTTQLSGLFSYLFVSIANVIEIILKKIRQLCTVCVALKKRLTDVR